MEHPGSGPWEQSRGPHLQADTERERERMSESESSLARLRWGGLGAGKLAAGKGGQ